MSGFASMPNTGSMGSTVIGGINSAKKTTDMMRAQSQSSSGTQESYSSASGGRASYRSRRKANLLGSGYEPEEMK